MYRVLVIPGARDGADGVLDLSAEIARLTELSESSASLHIDVIPESERTELDIVQRLHIGVNSYDAVHLLGHEGGDGFLLSQYESLSALRVSKICVDAGARMLFVNSCASGQMGQYAVNNGVAVAICYSIPVSDSDAIINVLRFYSTLGHSGDPFKDGLKEAYNAADPGDGSLMWLTNGEYVEQIISPIMARLDEMSVTHETSLSSFGQVVDATKNIVRDVDTRLSGQIVKLTANTKHTRYALISLIAIVLISTFALGWLVSSFGTSSAAALVATATVEEPVPPTWVPPTPTWTRMPPKNTHGATPQKPTRKPTRTVQPPTTTRIGETIPPVTATPRPTVTATLTESPAPTRTTTKTAQFPTRTPMPTDTDRPTRTAKPRATQTPTLLPTRTQVATATQTPWPTVFVPPIPTATATETLTTFEAAVKSAVEATIEARGCIC